MNPWEWLTNGLVLLVTAAAFWFLSTGWNDHSKLWRATVTPLASIIGSGFLVVAPLLGFTVGNWATLAIACIVGLAYLVGGAVRYNIAHVEAIIESNASACGIDNAIRWLGRMAKLSLVVAYVVAIAFYLKLLGAFVTRLFDFDLPNLSTWIATALTLLIAAFGFFRGLAMLESLEEHSVNATLSVILGLLAALALYNGELVARGNWRFAALESEWDWRTVRQLLGAFLIVQGFETSRYLRAAYEPAHRNRTMKLAQVIAGAIYLLFVALSTVLLDTFETVNETGIIDLSSRLATVLPILLIVGAVMSQFSSAVADTVGSGGLVEDTTNRRVRRHWTYAAVMGLALALIWSVEIFSVIAYASRAFAAYYAIQCGIAAMHALGRRGDRQSVARGIWFTLLGIVMVATAIFGIPAETAGHQRTAN